MKKILKIIFLFILFIAHSILAISQDKIYYMWEIDKFQESSQPYSIRYINTRKNTNLRPLVEQGIIFTFKSKEASKLFIAGDFTDWKPILMKKNKIGLWYIILKIKHPQKALYYKFLCDNIWIADPKNKFKIDDMSGSFLSILMPEIFKFEKEDHSISIEFVNNTIKFYYYNKDATLVSLVGDFNHWNPEFDYMRLNKKGIWEITKKIIPGEYKYKFFVDGKYIIDPQNPTTVSDPTHQLSSFLIVPVAQ